MKEYVLANNTIDEIVKTLNEKFRNTTMSIGTGDDLFIVNFADMTKENTTDTQLGLLCSADSGSYPDPVSFLFKKDSFVTIDETEFHVSKPSIGYDRLFKLAVSDNVTTETSYEYVEFKPKEND